MKWFRSSDENLGQVLKLVFSFAILCVIDAFFY